MAESLASLERQGLISSRHAQRVRRTHSQPSKMAKFDDKSKTDDRLPARGPADTDSRSIDKNQRASSAIAGKPSAGGRVGGSKRTPNADAIDQNQGPTFPRIGKGAKGGVPKKLRGTRSNPSGPMFGGPNGRP